jgi:hypothetical protein
VELTPACAHDRLAGALPESGSLSGKRNRVAPLRDVFETDHKKSCADILESIPDDTCIPSVCGLNFLKDPWGLLWFVNLSGSCLRRLRYFPELSNFVSPPAEPGVYLNEIRWICIKCVVDCFCPYKTHL